MRSMFGRLIVLGAIVLAVVAAVLPAAAAASSSSALVAHRADARASSSVSTASAAGTVAPCQDRAFNLIGGHWSKAVHWTFDGASTPDGFNVGAVEAVLIRSFNNITGADNDCGRADNVSAQNDYEGRATRSPNISRRATCTARDGQNVVGFGPLPRGILAATCTRHNGNLIVEADIRINSRYAWALNAANCSHQELLEPTVTHEVGHVYGLGHVSERRHPLLTMSTRSDGPCSNAASSLGLGDMLGLEDLY